ncbi:MAG: hypothetical protein ONA90_01700 [candidate division KSB1 bacterium]|nr:hypothetical protein [candidate division KSB1 bacterium]
MKNQKQIVVKFKAAKPQEANTLMENLQKRYARMQVEKLFPDQNDAELSALCVINVPYGEDTDQLLSNLRKDKKIEYVHESAERGFVGGKKAKRAGAIGSKSRTKN